MTEHALPSWLVVDTTVLRHFERLARLTKDFSGASHNPILPLMYWLGQEANDQLLDLLNARLDQSPQLGRIQAWRVFRDELEPRNYKRANRSDEAPPLPADEITPREHTQHDIWNNADQVAFRVLEPRRLASTRHRSNAVLSPRLRRVVLLELHAAASHLLDGSARRSRG